MYCRPSPRRGAAFHLVFPRGSHVVDADKRFERVRPVCGYVGAGCVRHRLGAGRVLSRLLNPLVENVCGLLQRHDLARRELSVLHALPLLFLVSLAAPRVALASYVNVSTDNPYEAGAAYFGLKWGDYDESTHNAIEVGSDDDSFAFFRAFVGDYINFDVSLGRWVVNDNASSPASLGSFASARDAAKDALSKGLKALSGVSSSSYGSDALSRVEPLEGFTPILLSPVGSAKSIYRTSDSKYYYWVSMDSSVPRAPDAVCYVPVSSYDSISSYLSSGYDCLVTMQNVNNSIRVAYYLIPSGSYSLSFKSCSDAFGPKSIISGVALNSNVTVLWTYWPSVYKIDGSVVSGNGRISDFLFKSGSISWSSSNYSSSDTLLSNTDTYYWAVLTSSGQADPLSLVGGPNSSPSSSDGSYFGVSPSTLVLENQLYSVMSWLQSIDNHLVNFSNSVKLWTDDFFNRLDDILSNRSGGGSSSPSGEACNWSSTDSYYLDVLQQHIRLITGYIDSAAWDASDADNLLYIRNALSGVSALLEAGWGDEDSTNLYNLLVAARDIANRLPEGWTEGDRTNLASVVNKLDLILGHDYGSWSAEDSGRLASVADALSVLSARSHAYGGGDGDYLRTALHQDLYSVWAASDDILRFLVQRFTYDPPFSPFEPSDEQKNEVNGTLEQYGYKVAQLQTKFPFSLPWDIQHFVGLLNAPPVAPVLTLPAVSVGEGGNVIDEITFDFSFLDPVIGAVRASVFLLFVVGMARLTMRLTGIGVSSGV